MSAPAAARAGETAGVACCLGDGSEKVAEGSMAPLAAVAVLELRARVGPGVDGVKCSLDEEEERTVFRKR